MDPLEKMDWRKRYVTYLKGSTKISVYFLMSGLIILIIGFAIQKFLNQTTYFALYPYLIIAGFAIMMFNSFLYYKISREISSDSIPESRDIELKLQSMESWQQMNGILLIGGVIACIIAAGWAMLNSNLPLFMVITLFSAISYSHITIEIYRLQICYDEMKSKD